MGAPMIARLWDRVMHWLHPHEAEHAKLAAQRDQLVADAKINSLVVRLQSRGLRRETGAEYQKMHAELGPINDLLARMDKRRND